MQAWLLGLTTVLAITPIILAQFSVLALTIHNALSLTILICSIGMIGYIITSFQYKQRNTDHEATKQSQVTYDTTQSKLAALLGLVELNHANTQAKEQGRTSRLTIGGRIARIAILTLTVVMSFGHRTWSCRRPDGSIACVACKLCPLDHCHMAFGHNGVALCLWSIDGAMALQLVLQSCTKPFS